MPDIRLRRRKTVLAIQKGMLELLPPDVEHIDAPDLRAFTLSEFCQV